MTLGLILPWFPIVLAVGIGGRLLGRARGLGLGMVCALFWIVLCQASGGPGLWTSLWSAASILAGALAIVAMGAWAGDTPVVINAPPLPAKRSGCQPSSMSETRWRAVAEAVDRFDDWLAEHRRDADPWPAFDEFVRSVLRSCCGASHVRPYRLVGEGSALVPLGETDPLAEDHRRVAHRGIIGDVLTTGRAYVLHAARDGANKTTEGAAGDDAVAWCFAVKREARPVGVVTVRHLEMCPEQGRDCLRVAERLISQFWTSLAEACTSRSATQNDPITGLPSREAFLRQAEQSIAESYSVDEPVAVGVIALERLRELNDSGRWELADELLGEVGRVLRRKVRMDDRLGRFDGSRFVVLFRRVDAELASLIASQVMARLSAVCGDASRWHTTISARCGVATSCAHHPTLRDLLSAALQQCRIAREEDRSIAVESAEASTAGAQAS